ncbi:methyltransferase domain-containing protein [Roseibium sp. SCPC15]|uniref:class I SAM-dependent methyltransferase n=1 Tax=Roseibium sp. SCP15 TaxID=3141376 RepID=UPI00333B87AC
MVNDGVDVMRRFAIRSGYDYRNQEAGAYETWQGKCINIGAGSFSHPNWTNLDVSSDHYVGIQPAGFVEYDLTKKIPLPFESNELDLAYCSHTVEHIKNDDASNLFREVYRCLKVGGVFRITCPNADLFYYAARMKNFSAFKFRTNHWFSKRNIDLDTVQPEDYLIRAFASQINPTNEVIERAKPQLLKEMRANLEEMDKADFLDWLTSKVKFSIKNVGSHINWWNHAKFSELLSEAGFDAIYPSTFGGSIAAPMRNTQKFDKTVPEESIYVEAIKTSGIPVF